MKQETIYTHTGTLITKEGERKVKLREAATSWTARIQGKYEAYDKLTGRRCGAPFGKRRLVLASIELA